MPNHTAIMRPESTGGRYIGGSVQYVKNSLPPAGLVKKDIFDKLSPGWQDRYSPYQIACIRDAYYALRDAAVFTKTDALALPMLTEADSLLNIVNPAAPFVNNGAVFSPANKGFLLNGIDQWIDSPVTPGVGSVPGTGSNYELGRAFVGVGINEGPATGDEDSVIGRRSPGGDTLRLTFLDRGEVAIRVNTGVPSSLAPLPVTERTGFWGVNRHDAELVQLYKNGVRLISDENAALTSMPTSNITFGRNSSAFVSGRMAGFMVGRAMSGIQAPLIGLVMGRLLDAMYG